MNLAEFDKKRNIFDTCFHMIEAFRIGKIPMEAGYGQQGIVAWMLINL